MTGNNDNEHESRDMDVNDWTEIQKKKQVRKHGRVSGSSFDGEV